MPRTKAPAVKAHAEPLPTPKSVPLAPPKTRKADDLIDIRTFTQNPTAIGTIAALMEADLSYQEEQKAIESSRSEIKRQLSRLLAENDAPDGARWNSWCVYITRGKTRRTLDKTLLVLNGCPASVIEQSYKESKPYDDVRVVDLAKPRAAEDSL